MEQSKPSQKILQTGLYSVSDKDVESIVHRVSAWNLRNLANPIKLDVIPFEKGDKENNMEFPHYKLRFLFPNKNAQKNFWTN